MKLLKLLLALSLLTQLPLVHAQDDMSDEGWSEESSVPAEVTPVVKEDAAGEEEMPIYDEGSDY